VGITHGRVTADCCCTWWLPRPQTAEQQLSSLQEKAWLAEQDRRALIESMRARNFALVRGCGEAVR
jgi:hypothetical protein